MKVPSILPPFTKARTNTATANTAITAAAISRVDDGMA
jgi:hypothetical protein